MLNKIQKPKNKQDLIKAINQANIKSINVYEGSDLNYLPSKDVLCNSKSTVVILK
jgi:hypothetical protein